MNPIPQDVQVRLTNALVEVGCDRDHIQQFDPHDPYGVEGEWADPPARIFIHVRPLEIQGLMFLQFTTDIEADGRNNAEDLHPRQPEEFDAGLAEAVVRLKERLSA